MIVISKTQQICSVLSDKSPQYTESSNNPCSQTLASYLSRLISSYAYSAASLNTCCSSRTAAGSTAPRPSHHLGWQSGHCAPFTPSTPGPSLLCYELYYFDLSPSIRFNWIMICNHFLSGESIKWSRASAPPGRPPLLAPIWSGAPPFRAFKYPCDIGCPAQSRLRPAV